MAGYKARYAPDHPDIVNTEREVQGLEKQVTAEDGTSDVARRLEDAKAKLARAQEKYAPEHPDVVRLTHEVQTLEAAVAAAPATSKARQRSHADNPAYIQVKGQLDSLDVEHDGAIQKRDDLRAKRDNYERRLAQEPAVERQYRELARDLESAQLKYQEIRSKQTEVQVSQNLETEHKGERFTMIEPPLPPEKPISPNRFLILAMGFVLSLGAGAGAAMLSESLDVSIRGAHDIRALLNVAAARRGTADYDPGRAAAAGQTGHRHMGGRGRQRAGARGRRAFPGASSGCGMGSPAAPVRGLTWSAYARLSTWREWSGIGCLGPRDVLKPAAETPRPDEMPRPAETIRSVASFLRTEIVGLVETRRDAEVFKLIEGLPPAKTAELGEARGPTETTPAARSLDPVETVRPVEAIGPVETTDAVEICEAAETHATGRALEHG